MFHFLPLLAILLDYFLEVPDTASEPQSPLASIISVFGPFSALVFGIAALLLRPLPRKFSIIASAGGLLGLIAIIVPMVLSPQPRIVYAYLDSASGGVPPRRNLRPHYFPYRAGQSRICAPPRHEQAINPQRDRGRLSHSHCGAPTYRPCVVIPRGNLGGHRVCPGHARVL